MPITPALKSSSPSPAIELDDLTVNTPVTKDGVTNHSKTFIPLPPRPEMPSTESAFAPAPAPLMDKSAVQVEPSFPPAKPVTEPSVAPLDIDRPSVASTTDDPRVKEPDLIPVELPSGFVMYAFDQLYARPIRGVHQAKFSAAAKSNSLLVFVDAVSSLLSGASARDLTVSDFRWVLYFLRTTNYPSIPMEVQIACNDAGHIAQVEAKELKPTTLIQLSTVNGSTLDEKPLDFAALETLVDNESALADMNLGFQTMGDMLELVDMIDALEVKGVKKVGNEMQIDPTVIAHIDEIKYLAESAGVLSQIDIHGNAVSIGTRLDMVRALPAEQVSALRRYTVWSSEYGVSEIFRTRCIECGAHIREEYRISADMFL